MDKTDEAFQREEFVSTIQTNFERFRQHYQEGTPNNFGATLLARHLHEYIAMNGLWPSNGDLYKTVQLQLEIAKDSPTADRVRVEKTLKKRNINTDDVASHPNVFGALYCVAKNVDSDWEYRGGLPPPPVEYQGSEDEDEGEKSGRQSKSNNAKSNKKKGDANETDADKTEEMKLLSDVIMESFPERYLKGGKSLTWAQLVELNLSQLPEDELRQVGKAVLAANTRGLDDTTLALRGMFAYFRSQYNKIRGSLKRKRSDDEDEDEVEDFAQQTTKQRKLEQHANELEAEILKLTSSRIPKSDHDLKVQEMQTQIDELTSQLADKRKKLEGLDLLPEAQKQDIWRQVDIKLEEKAEADRKAEKKRAKAEKKRLKAETRARKDREFDELVAKIRADAEAAANAVGVAQGASKI